MLLGKMSKKYKKWFYQVEGVKNTQVLQLVVIKSFSKKPNKKTYRISPKRHDKDVSIASLFMRELYYGADSRCNEISKFKSENIKVVSFLKELAAKQAEIVD